MTRGHRIAIVLCAWLLGCDATAGDLQGPTSDTPTDASAPGSVDARTHPPGDGGDARGNAPGDATGPGDAAVDGSTADAGLSDGGTTDTGRTSNDPLASLVVSPPPAGMGTFADRVALNIHELGALDQVVAAGIHHVRTDANWESIESQKGVYDFSAFIDPATSAFAARGIKPLWLLSYGNPIYGDQPDQNGCYGISSDASQQAFANYAVALVNHLPKGQWWEIWNEPKGMGPLSASRFASLCAAVAQAIHAADPTAVVVTGGNAGFIDTVYLDDTLTAGGGAGADGIGLHMYQWLDGADSPTAEPERLFDATRDDGLPAWEAVKAKHGIATRTWNTEGGYCTDDIPTGDSSWQTRMVTRYLLTAWTAGFPLFVLYDKSDGCWSLLDHAATLTAVTTLSTMAADRTFTGSTFPSDPTKLHVVRLEGATDVVYVLWMRTGTLAVDVPAGTTAYRMNGDSFATTSSLVIDATAGPVYVKFAK